MLADYSVAVAMELFQGQEGSPILTFENYIFHCSHAILTRPSKFYCLIAGGMHRNVDTIKTMLLFSPLALDSKAVTGLATPVNPIAEHTTININAGVVLD